MTELSLEEQSFRNMVYFYMDRLEDVKNGSKSEDLFTCRERNRLCKYGVIQRIRNSSGNQYFLSARAREVLIRIDS